MEWIDEGGPKKQPYFIRRRGGRPSLLASIGQFAGGEHDGLAIITVNAQGKRLMFMTGDLSCYPRP